MGRYRFHQFDDDEDDDDDDDDDGHGRSAMDWTGIPKDDDNDDEDVTVNGAYRAFIPSPPPSPCDDDDEHDNDYYTNNKSRRSNGFNDIHMAMHETRSTERRLIVGFNHSNPQLDDQLADEYYLERSGQYHETNTHGPRNRLSTRILAISFIVVAIIAIVLKRYAPPPPQTSMFTVIPPLAFSTDTTDGVATNHDYDASDLLHQRDIAHYETWGDYSCHVSSVFHHALVHVLSVAWYAISNSLRSAYDDLIVGWNELFPRYGLDNCDTTDESTWRTTFDKIMQSPVLDYTTWWSHLQASSGIVSGENTHRASHNFQHGEYEDVGSRLASFFSKYGWGDSCVEYEWLVATEKFVQSSIIGITTWFFKLQTTVTLHSDDSHRGMHDIQHDEDGDNVNIAACPIRIPAASNRFAQLTRQRNDATSIISEGIVIDTVWSTEEYLRQTIGTSLSPQNLALKVISERMDTWGNDLVELAQVTLLRKMSSAMEPSVRRSRNDDKTEWILPPAIGFFVVGSAGVGKLTIAHRLAHFLLGHCLDGKASSDQHDNIDGVLEVVMSEQYHYNNDHVRYEERTQSMKESIVNHIQRREGLGSVVILHHIESMHPTIVTEISQVLNGKSYSLIFQSLDNEQLVEANCNGTVFIMTSKAWGTTSIIRHVVHNNGWNVLRSRDSLTSSIRQEVDSHVDISSNTPTMFVPVLPFQQDDLASILQDRVQALSFQYQGIVWKRIEISLAAIRYFVGVDHIKYSNLSTVHHDEHHHYAYSTFGAHALDDNMLLQALYDIVAKPGVERHPDMTLRIGLDGSGSSIDKATLFRWCNTLDGLESCEEIRDLGSRRR